MPQVLPMKVDGAVVRGVYHKVSTEGDAYRFVTAESGIAQIIHKNDPIRAVAGSGSGGVTWKDFTLDAPYLIGVDQMEVFLVSNTNGMMTRIPNSLTLYQARQANPSWPSALLNPALSGVVSFEEIAYDKVRVYNIPASGYDAILFSVPHTSLPGALRERVQIKRQGDRIAIELLGEGDGIVLRSEGGKRGLLRVDDELNLGIDPA